MRCSRCGRKIDNDVRSCPHCGGPLAEGLAGMLKTSTILISEEQNNQVYRSVREVPEPLRQRLLSSTNGILSRTILIADRRGRREIEQARRNLLGTSNQRARNSALGRIVPSARRKLTLTQAIGILLMGAAGLLAWLLLSHH